MPYKAYKTLAWEKINWNEGLRDKCQVSVPQNTYYQRWLGKLQAMLFEPHLWHFDWNLIGEEEKKDVSKGQEMVCAKVQR